MDQEADGVAALVLDGPGKTNLLDEHVLQDLDEALRIIEEDQRFRVCVLRSKKGASFCHGVGSETLSGLQTVQAWEAFTQHGQRLCERLSGLRVPTVAVIAGACLGAGLELALACEWRIAVDHPSTLLGFHELDFGLVPAWGGIGRVLTLVGLERGLQMLLGGKKLLARDALRFGLVDDLAEADSPALPLLETKPAKRPPGLRGPRSWRQRLLEATRWGRRLALRGAERVLRRRLPDDMPAPWAILELVRAELERRNNPERTRAELIRLASSEASGNLVRLHVLQERHRAVPGADRPKKIGVLGATPLALHLAVQAAAKGCEVVLRVPDELTLGVAALQIVKALQEETRRSGMSQALFQANVNRVRPTTAWRNFEELDIVLDAAPGGMEARRSLYHDLEEHIPTDAAIVLVQPWLAAMDFRPGLSHPERLLGMHFPPPLGRTLLAEILAGPACSAQALARVRAHAAALGKTTLIVDDDQGSVVQRVLFPGILEALHLLEEGVLPERLEHALLRFGMVYGPLEYLDWVGIDEFVLISRRLGSALGEPVADPPIIEHMLRQRWLGIKTGVGFYVHKNGRKSPNKRLTRWLQRSFSANITPRSRAEEKELVEDRIVGRTVAAALQCLETKAIAGPEELDLALMLAGWAPHRGGPCRYAAQSGNRESFSRVNK